MPQRIADEVWSRADPADARQTRAAPDQIDLHDHRRRPTQALIDSQQYIGENGLIQDWRAGWNVFYRVVRPQVFALLDVAVTMVGGKPGQRKAVAAQRQARRACWYKCSRVGRVAIDRQPARAGHVFRPHWQRS